jgi:hypothetical protein
VPAANAVTSTFAAAAEQEQAHITLVTF